MPTTKKRAKNTNVNSNCQYTDTNGFSLRQRVFKELAKNDKLKPKRIIDLLSLQGFPTLNYPEHGQTIRQYKADWKRQYANGVAPQCPKLHKRRGWIYVPKGLRRVVGLGCSVKGSRTGVVCWRLSRNRNKSLLFDCRGAGLGRLEWFETGRVNFWIREPASWLQVKKLLAYGFFATGLIGDINVFTDWFVREAHTKGAHANFDLGEKLPYFETDFFKESNGITRIKMGDDSHPNGVEVEFGYPDWIERNEKLIETRLPELQQELASLRLEVKGLTEANIELTNTLGVLVKKLQGVPSESEGSVVKPIVAGQDYAV